MVTVRVLTVIKVENNFIRRSSPKKLEDFEALCYNLKNLNITSIM